MVDRFGMFFSLSWRILWCLFPFVTEVARASLNKTEGTKLSVLSNDNVRNVASNYSDTILVLACFLFLFAGTFVGYFYPTPKYGLKPYPKYVKVFISIIGGMLAFFYYLEDNQNITPAVCIYVAGVSFVAPAIIHLIHAFAIKFTGNNLNITDEDLDRINRSFKDEE